MVEQGVMIMMEMVVASSAAQVRNKTTNGEEDDQHNPSKLAQALSMAASDLDDCNHIENQDDDTQHSANRVINHRVNMHVPQTSLFVSTFPPYF